MPRKIQGCGTIVRIDTDDTEFTTLGQCDSVTPFGQSKAIVNSPTLECTLDGEVGREEQSTMEVAQFWDPTDASHNRIDASFTASIANPALRDIQVQVVSPGMPDGEGETDVVTMEATCQVVSISPEAITPDGHWKRTITLIRTSAIAKTIVNSGD